MRKYECVEAEQGQKVICQEGTIIRDIGIIYDTNFAESFVEKMNEQFNN